MQLIQAQISFFTHLCITSSDFYIDYEYEMNIQIILSVENVLLTKNMGSNPTLSRHHVVLGVS